MTLGIAVASLALLQGGGGGGGGSQSPFLNSFLIQIALIIAIFYWLVFRPQSKQRKAHEAALFKLQRGDRIVTSGGIIGEVIHIKQTVSDGKPAPLMEDEVTIKSAESRLIVERGRIAKVVSSAAAPSSSTSSAPATKT